MKEIFDVYIFKLNDKDKIVLNDNFLSRKKRKIKKQIYINRYNIESSISSEISDNLDEDLKLIEITRKNISIITIASLKKIFDELQNYKIAIRLSNVKYYKKVIDDKIQSILINNVFESIQLLKNKHAITIRQIFKKKLRSNEEVIKYKARLVERGFQ